MTRKGVTGPSCHAVLPDIRGAGDPVIRATMKLALVAAAFVAGSKAEEAADHERPSFPDHIRPDQTSFFTFGSCSKQYLEQPAWREMLKKGPEMFLWVGDAVYAESHHPRGALDAVRDAFAAQSARKDYADFVSNVAVDGT